MSSYATISKHAFSSIQKLFAEASGIVIPAAKYGLVAARLQRRLIELQLDSYDAYCAFLRERDLDGIERRHMIDLLTTNETFFFREPRHFELLATALQERLSRKPVRVWSAACSTGEEAFSVAMTLMDKRPDGAWEVKASDLSTRVLERARRAEFSSNRLDCMPERYLKRFCTLGEDAQTKVVHVKEAVKKRVQFFRHNLLDDAAHLGTFDIIFVRNVLIYFEIERRQAILNRLTRQLVPGGLLFVGHSESLHGLVLPVRKLDRALYEKV